MAARKIQDNSVPVLRNPLSVKQMAGQIQAACDLYTALKLSEHHFKELICHYARAHGNKLFGKNGTLNPTIDKIIGKKRKELVGIMLSDFQMTMF